MKKTIAKIAVGTLAVAAVGAALVPMASYAETSNADVSVVVDASAAINCTQGGNFQETVANGQTTDALMVRCVYSTNNPTGYDVTFTTSATNGNTNMNGQATSSFIPTVAAASTLLATGQTTSAWGYAGSAPSLTVDPVLASGSAGTNIAGAATPVSGGTTDSYFSAQVGTSLAADTYTAYLTYTLTARP